MTLPPRAYERLLLPLRNVSVLARSARDCHTIPIDGKPWRLYAGALADAIASLSQDLIPPSEGFKELQDWIEGVLRRRDCAVGLLFSLEPFEPYDPCQADGLLDLLDEIPARIITAVEDDAFVNRGFSRALTKAADWWFTREPASDRQGLSRAFGMDIPPNGTQGPFRAEWVLQHYAYRNSDLLTLLIPHLVSLGIPHVTDVLAGVYAVGQVIDCDDPIVAYLATKSLTNSYLAADPKTADQVRDHLGKVEPALRRARTVATHAFEVVLTETDNAEARALALADAYKRTLEGPFRQYSWAAHCLRTGAWSTPPMLTNLRERLISEGGALAEVVRGVVLSNLRNSETHETLVWDGFTDQFVTEMGRVDIAHVTAASSLAVSFVQGSEAGLAAIRGLHIRADAGTLPFTEEEGRMPTWDRVSAFFGTNRITLIEARLNTPHPHFRVQRIEHRDINPCFQALVLARRLLPRAERFEVSAVESSFSVIVVDASALDATMPSWEFAVSHLDQMPLSTFLPANLDARRRLEREPDALRSAAWIAVDDAVGVIDGSPERWDDDTRQLVDTCLQVVEIAVASTMQRVDALTARLESVQQSVAALRSWIASESPLQAVLADGQPSMVRLRTQWNKWGPVPRHPLIPELPPTGDLQAPPALRSAPESIHYRTL